MELEIKKYSKHDVDSTTIKNKMELAEGSEGMIFQIFTKKIYSNPIGSVVREITSNCFDSHVEAGVNYPVLIKKTYDNQTESTHISFIDYGIGMSPERIKNIYSTYFASTKRETNDQIGAFGLGSKTPLAYKRYYGEGEDEYDNSFFVITNYNGIKYVYNVFEGEESPEWTPVYQEETDERNGTEIRIPVLEKDVSKFEYELTRQLYYFENIVFEGFSNNVENNYTIIRGKNFLYRGDTLDSRIHVCLGKVYYPIDYKTLGLNGYEYSIPVAINVPIGKINVTVSRETLDYSESTIKYLRKRLEEVKSELIDMLSIQYDNVKTLEDYFRVKNDFGYLYLNDNKKILLDQNVISKKNIDYRNFKYNDIHLPNSAILFDLFFNVGIYGLKEKKSYYGKINEKAHMLSKSYNGIVKAPNVYYVEGNDFSRKRILQSYLKDFNDGRFYVVRKKSLLDNMEELESQFNIELDIDQNYNKYVELQEDFFKIVQKYCENYQNIDVPDDYIIQHKKSKTLSKEILKTTIPIKIHGVFGKKRVRLKDLINYNGQIFYGETVEEYKCSKSYQLFYDLFDKDYITNSYDIYNNKFYGYSDYHNIMFITLAKSNLKYVKYFKNAYHIDNFYHKIARRKIDDVINVYLNKDIINKYDNIDNFYKSELFNQTFEKWGEKNNTINKHVNEYPKKYEIFKYFDYYSQYIDLSKIKSTHEQKEIEKIIRDLEAIEEKNKEILSYIRIPNQYSYIIGDNEDKKNLKSIFKNILNVK